MLHKLAVKDKEIEELKVRVGELELRAKEFESTKEDYQQLGSMKAHIDYLYQVINEKNERLFKANQE